MESKIIKIAILASGAGTNFENICLKCKEHKINGKVALLITNNPKASAIKKAKKLGVETLVLNPKKTSREQDRQIASICKRKKINLICLAGYLSKIGKYTLGAFKNKILNIHPALLPAFGGKGFYGDKIFRSVLQKQVSLSGVTVHLIDENYDNGPVVLQKEIAISPNETVKTLAEKTHKLEHLLYPKAVELFCDGRIKLANGRVKILPAKPNNKIKTALISVSDKTNILDFARKLHKTGIELISTSGTAKLLKKNGICVTDIETLTGSSEMLDGRVKTLHPAIYAGILFKRDNKNHLQQTTDIKPIDMVVVNLYPFDKTFAKEKNKLTTKAIEQIDIGGVTLLRAAGKNFENVSVVSDPCDYQMVYEQIAKQGTLDLETKKYLAYKAFEKTANYDCSISTAFANTSDNVELPNTLNIKLEKVTDLRYGENPHQRAWVYSDNGKFSFTQLNGRELSYNNLLDANSAFSALCEFKKPACVIVKHLTPCGVAESSNLARAFELAWNCDSLSAFGGIIAINRKLDGKTAKLIAQNFVEVVIAPDYDKTALKILRKKKNLRLLKKSLVQKPNLTLRSAGSEILISTADDKLFEKSKVVTKTKISKKQMEQLIFAYKAVKHIKSNAIVLTSSNATVGIGAGQMSRVDAVKMAGLKYKQYLKNNKKPKALVMASDGFFPFGDAIAEAKKLGVSAIAQPGGSVKDKEVIKTCNKLGVAMVFTGMRHFRH